MHILTPIPRPVRRRRRTSVTRLLAPAAPCALVRPVTILGASPPMNCRARAARQRRERRRHRREYHHDAPTPTRPSARARPASFSSRSTTPRHRFVSFVRSRLTSRLPSPRAFTRARRSAVRRATSQSSSHPRCWRGREPGVWIWLERSLASSEPKTYSSSTRVSRCAPRVPRARSRATQTFQINAFRRARESRERRASLGVER